MLFSEEYRSLGEEGMGIMKELEKKKVVKDNKRKEKNWT